jgi:hypothetical protein
MTGFGPDRWYISVLVGALAIGSTARGADIEAEPINYAKAPVANAVSRLEQRLANGKATLTYEPGFGYLRSLLRELQVPQSSQTLVFSKTSLQRHRIAPMRPRALYFGDDVYVGFCQRGDVLEVTAVDPSLGAVFYTLDQKTPDKPRFTRQTDTCTICHGSSANQGIPGNLIRSVYPDEDGLPILSAGSYRIDQTNPLEQRWGGWYVTGTSGKQRHLGNLTLPDNVDPIRIDNSKGINVTDLSDYFKTKAYLTPYSDLIALLTLEHQTEMHNLIGRASLLTRMALYEEASLNKALGRPVDFRSESTVSRIKSAGEPLVKYMLFSGEAPLSERVRGTSHFAEKFSKRGPRSARGHSLRDFDLEHRLFVHPCSYLIYSQAFEGMPPPMKEYVYRRLWEVLSGQDAGEAFRHLTATDRRAILEILRDTKSNLPSFWRLDTR